MTTSLFIVELLMVDVTPVDLLGSVLCDQSPAELENWPGMLAIAQRFDVLALVYWQLQEHSQALEVIPVPFGKVLRRAYYTALARASLLERALTEILRAFDAVSMPVLLLKGAALAHTVYPDPALRMMGDLDLLVRPDDVARAREVLEKLGYVHNPEPLQRINPFNTTFTGETSFCHATHRRATPVDLHWELFTIEWLRHAVQLDLEGLWKRAVPLEIGDATAWVLVPEDMLMHICLHLSLHGFTHLRGYVDIVQLVKRGAIDWDVFVDRTRRSRLCAACYFPLWWVASHWEVPVPRWVLAALRPDPLRVYLGRWMIAQGIRREPDIGHAWNHVAQLLIIDRLLDLIRVLVWFFFPGLTWLRERYRLRSPWQAWVWMFVHPVVVLWEGVCSVGTFFYSALLSFLKEH